MYFYRRQRYFVTCILNNETSFSFLFFLVPFSYHDHHDRICSLEEKTFMKCGRKVSVEDAIENGNNILPTLVFSHATKKEIIPRDQWIAKITRAHWKRSLNNWISL